MAFPFECYMAYNNLPSTTVLAVIVTLGNFQPNWSMQSTIRALLVDSNIFMKTSIKFSLFCQCRQFPSWLDFCEQDQTFAIVS